MDRNQKLFIRLCELEFKYPQKILEYIINNSGDVIAKPAQSDVERFNEEAIKILQNKYPDAGIKKAK